MDKKTFLLNLRQSLSVLKEEELQDIVSEYEQHIDMKVENGLTEEEAIADFGSMTELTAEILEAYHVRADYAGAVSGRRMKADRGFGNISLQSVSNLEEKSRISEAAGKVKEAVTRWGKLLGAGFSAAGTIVKRGFIWGKRQISRPFLWIWGMLRRGEESDEPGGTGEGTKRVKQGRRKKEHMRRDSMERRGYGEEQHGVMYMIGEGISRIFHGCINAVRWCVRLAWNMCCVGASLMVGFFGLFCLYGLGVLLVLVLQGYPLWGITLGCLGLVLCMFSLAGFGFTLRWIPERQKEIGNKERGSREREQRESARRQVMRRGLREEEPWEERRAESKRGESKRGESKRGETKRRKLREEISGYETDEREQQEAETERGEAVRTGTDMIEAGRIEEDIIETGIIEAVRTEQEIDTGISESGVNTEGEQHA